ncbi:class I SAM-dependent methyltransferase [Aldersonia kunmingensis]|uniref:class I SAM-dependent methyltransferase n=1 Tax=Aldersonia kunmingensis TaxID=408066 RepID=UPI000AE849F5|nr:methyltransferase domain-containing protein [Aldersonia kunmingensis]
MSTTPSEQFGLSAAAAESYEADFVPAFFAQWAPMLCDAASVYPGARTLDIGCGTGILTRTAADRAGPEGIVEGLDLNEAMLEVARRIRPDLTFRRGDASALPYPDRSFDIVLSQMALMFFPDRGRALGEMARVAVPGATVGLLVPAALNAQPAFAPFVQMVTNHAGPEAADLLGSYFVCGNLEAVADETARAGLQVRTARTVDGIYRAPSVDAFVTTEVESTPLRDRLDDVTYRRIRSGAQAVLADFRTAAGAVQAPFAANLVIAART